MRDLLIDRRGGHTLRWTSTSLEIDATRATSCGADGHDDRLRLKVDALFPAKDASLHRDASVSPPLRSEWDGRPHRRAIRQPEQSVACAYRQQAVCRSQRSAVVGETIFGHGVGAAPKTRPDVAAAHRDMARRDVSGDRPEAVVQRGPALAQANFRDASPAGCYRGARFCRQHRQGQDRNGGEDKSESCRLDVTSLDSRSGRGRALLSGPVDFLAAY
jgi:hypothetical protein